MITQRAVSVTIKDELGGWAVASTLRKLGYYAHTETTPKGRTRVVTTAPHDTLLIVRKAVQVTLAA